MSRWTAWSSASWPPATCRPRRRRPGRTGDREAIRDVLFAAAVAVAAVVRALSALLDGRGGPRRAAAPPRQAKTTVRRPLSRIAVLAVPLHRARQRLALHVPPDRHELVRGDLVPHPLDLLLDDRPLVEVGRHIVRGRADQLDAARVRLVVRLRRP